MADRLVSINTASPAGQRLPLVVRTELTDGLDLIDGYDTRLDDSRVPINGSVSLAKLAADVLGILSPLLGTADSFVTDGGTVVLTSSNNRTIIFTGTSAETVRMPSTGVKAGMSWLILNRSSSSVTVQSSGASTITSVSPNGFVMLTAQVDTPATVAQWAGWGATGSKVLKAAASLTLAGTDFTTMTFPSASGTVVTLDAVQALLSKTLDLASNTLTGTTAQFNAALSDADFAVLDANGNLAADVFIPNQASITTSAGVATLTIADTQVQVFTGATTHTVKLPTTGVKAGMTYVIVNQSTGAVTVQSSGANTIQSVPAGGIGVFTAQRDTPTTAAHWVGTVTSGGKALKATASITIAGSDFTTMTFPNVNGAPTVRTGTVPATATAAGVVGQIEWDSTFIYVCVAANTWVRAALATW